MAIMLAQSTDRVQVPWKNGAGITEEIALLADASGTPIWRISVADLPAAPSAFSAFDGFDRIFTIIGEHGVVLDFSGSTVEVDPLTPYRFTDDSAPQCHPRGHTRALNVMAQHDSTDIAVSPLPGHGRRPFTTDPAVITGAFVISGSISAGDLVAHPDDCFLIHHSEQALSVDGTAILIEITPH